MSDWLARLDRRFLAPLPVERLAVLRLAIGGFALVYAVVRAGHFIGAARLPPRHFAPVGVVRLLSAPLPPALATALVLAALLAGVAFVAGWRFRWTGPAFAILLLWITSYRSSWGMIFHTENLLVLHVGVLGIAPAADAYSLDRRHRDVVPPGPAHGWPVRLMCLVTVLTYLVSALAKLRVSGLAWVTSDILRNTIAFDNLRKIALGDVHSPIGGALVRQAWLWRPFAVVSLVMELGAPLALLDRRVARIWALVAWGFHVGVLALMAIFFPYPLFGFAFAPLFAVERIVPWWRERRRRRATATGRCRCRSGRPGRTPGWGRRRAGRSRARPRPRGSGRARGRRR